VLNRFLLMIFIAFQLFSGCVSKSEKSGNDKECLRIVSTAPSITETLFELGLGDRIVGVSNSCLYPESAKDIDKIGKVLDLSYESILLKKPDTVIFTEYHSAQAGNLSKLGVRTLSVDHSSLKGFIESLDSISKLCKVHSKGQKIEKEYDAVLKERFYPDLEEEKQIKVMIVVGREYLESGIKDVYIAGNDGFYSELLLLFNGISNVYEGNIAYPKIQTEGIVNMSPDIIIEVITDNDMSQSQTEKIYSDWERFKKNKNMHNSTVFVINKQYWSIPGPRFINIVEDMKDIFNIKNSGESDG